MEELDIYLQEKHGKMSIFKETQLMSTYLLCFAVGNFLEIEL